MKTKVPTLKSGQVILSPSTGNRYKIGEVLGQGGFGTAYRASELNRRGKPIEDVCFKTTLDQASWHRESYFGELLSRSRRAVKTLDSFPISRKTQSQTRMLFCLVLELAEHGTVASYLEKTGRPWSPGRARREIIALLKMLDQLHGAAATHRDITPMNVFVCGKSTLKLGDFGIARHQLAGQRRTLDAFNPWYVSQSVVLEAHHDWMAIDDVFQMGQLLAMLLRGDADTLVTSEMVDELTCDEPLKQIIKRAIGPRRKRYGDAFEMLQALQGNEGAASGQIASLKDKTVVFTGPMSITRLDAELQVLQAGGSVSRDVTRKVDVVVQGRRSRNYNNGHKGHKLKQAEQLLKQGCQIHIIGEAEFRRLVHFA